MTKISEGEGDFPIQDQEQALNFKNELTNIKFLLWLHWILDVFLQMTKWSKLVQAEKGLLIGQSKLQLSIKGYMEYLKYNNGDNLKMFLTQFDP